MASANNELALELLGVITDIQLRGLNSFDSVCLGTIKRVYHVLRKTHAPALLDHGTSRWEEEEIAEAHGSQEGHWKEPIQAPWMDAFDEARDAILHGRGTLEAMLDNDQTNAVLSVLDSYFMPRLKRRALEAEDLVRKFTREVNGPTSMGEPLCEVKSLAAKSEIKPMVGQYPLGIAHGATIRKADE